MDPTTPIQFPDAVDVVEVFPRDGLQRHDAFVPTETKVDLVERLAATGVTEVEVTSFTHPEAVPNLRDAEDVFAGIDRDPAVTYSALVPNEVGMERALACDVDKVGALVTASPEYNRRNQNMTIEESVAEVERIVELAAGTDVTVEAGIAQAFFSPYEGVTPPERTLDLVDRMLELGVDELSLATSNGMADPRQVSELLAALFDRHPDADVGLHLHDTNGMSLATVVVAMQHGVRQFDASLCGLGGGVILPDALKSVGNTPTEDLVNTFREMGIDTGVDFDALERLAREVTDELDLEPDSHVLRGGTREFVLETTEEA